MELGLKEWIVIFTAGVFLLLFLLATESITNQEELDVKRLTGQSTQNIQKVTISSMNLQLKLDSEEEKMYLNSELSFERKNTEAIISGINGNMVLGGKFVKTLVVSCVSADISGKSNLENLTILSTNVNFNNLIIQEGGNIKISAASVQGNIHIDDNIKRELYIEISSASNNLTVFVSNSVKDKVKFSGSMPKVVDK